MKKVYRTVFSALSAGLLITALSTQAQAQESKDSTQAGTDDALLLIVDDLGVEDLLNMKVTVASKKEERLADAPGSITAYLDRDIEKFGYYTLADLASITPGFSAFKGLNEEAFETRGQYTSGGFANNKHVVLIDGIPVYNARANMAPSDEILPLIGAQRVEFLRGPGSALYGVGAFNGVVNIISKDLEKEGTKIESKFSLGNYDFKKRFMTNIIHKSSEGTAKFSMGYFGKDATRQYLGNGLRQDETSKYNDDKSSIFINTSYKLSESALKGTSLGLIYQRKNHGLGEWWMDQQNQTYQFTSHTWEQIIPYLRYERKLTDKLTLNTYLKGNMSTEKYVGSNGWQAALYWSGAGLSAFNIRVFETEFFGEGKYEFSKKVSAVLGVNYVNKYGSGAPENYVYYVKKDQSTLYNYDDAFSARTSTYRTYSNFGQVQANLDLLKGLNITAGYRMDMGRVLSAKDNSVTNKYDQFSPRIAVVQKVTDGLNLKLMYGAALRAPQIAEVGGNEEAKGILQTKEKNDVANVPNLKAETIKNYEAAVTYSKGKINASGTIFSNTTNDALYRGVTPIVAQPITQNINGQIMASGFELDLTVIPVKNLKVGANFSRAKATMPQVYSGKDTIAGGDSYNVPTDKINGTVTYSCFAPVKFSVSLIARHIQSYRVGGYTPWRGSNPGGTAKDMNTVYGGMNLVDMNTIVEVTKNVSLEFQVRNLFDVEYRTPAFFASRQLNVPGARRSFLFTVAYKF